MSIQQTNQNKYPSGNISFQELYIRLSVNKQPAQTYRFPINNDQIVNKTSSKLILKIDTILKMANSIIIKNKIILSKFMNIFIEMDKKKVNIFRIKNQGSNKCDNVLNIKRQDQCFYLDVWIIQVGKIQSNPLLQLTTQRNRFNETMQKLKQINRIFTKQIQSLNDDQKCSYDIAYLFAEPLVYPQRLSYFPKRESNYQNLKNDKPYQSESDVSFQKEYDRFIGAIQSQQYFSNLTIEMMVATENNIRQVLNERCNILHFSCHGQVQYLKIQKDKDVGYLDAFTIQRLIKLLQGKVLPKIIIFNSCFSEKIACQVNKAFPSITTIGYNDQANDKYCQLLTQQIYKGIYLLQKSVFKLFDQIKKKIASQDERQAKKLVIFKSSQEVIFDSQATQLSTNRGYKIDLVYLKNLGRREPIGIKKVLYEFIRDYLLNKDNIISFIIGYRNSGKSLFIRKALYYTMHRGMFQKQIFIDCFQGQIPILNTLQFKIQCRKKIFKFINEFKDVNIIIIIDHCNFLVKNQPEEFMKIIRKFAKQIKFGKIILIADNFDFQSSLSILEYQNKHYHQQVSLSAQNTKQFRIYLARWRPQIKKNYLNNQFFLRYKFPILMRALQETKCHEEFLQHLKNINQKQKNKEDQLILIDIQKKFASLKGIFTDLEQKIRIYLTSGYFSRNQITFMLLQIFPQFTSPVSQVMSRKQKSILFQQLGLLYEGQIKNLILDLTQTLGKFSSKTLQQSWYESHIIFFYERIFLVVGLALILNQQRQVQAQLYNCYTLVAQIINRYQKLINHHPKIMAQCQSKKLKIYMSLYNFYKQQYYASLNDKCLDKYRNNIIMRNIQQDINIQFSPSHEIQSSWREPFIQNQTYPQNNEFGLRNSITQKDNTSQVQISSLRDSYNPSRIQGIISQRQSSGIRGQPAQRSAIRQSQNRRNSVFPEFLKQIKEEYSRSQFRELVQRVQQLDTIVRLIQLQQSKVFKEYMSSNASTTLFQLSISESHKNFQSVFNQIQKFYKVYERILTLYERYQSSTSQQQRADNFQNRQDMKRLFFSQSQLNMTYLKGLKFIKKLSPIIDNEYIFDYQEWYRQSFRTIRERLVKAQKILQSKFSKKINIDRDLSYKKVYSQYLEVYIDIRFTVQKIYTSFIPNGQKELLFILNKLLKMTQSSKLIRLKDRIQIYIQKYFYNKCSILVSEPIGYVTQSFNVDMEAVDKKRVSGNKCFGKSKEKTRQKKNPKKQCEVQQLANFRPLNWFRNSDLILNEIKKTAQKQVVNQIHIQIETLSYQKLKCSPFGSYEQEKKRKILIYFIVCDVKKSQNHELILLQNQQGKSVKYQMEKLLKVQNVGFPYAPVIILYGTNVQAIQSRYKQYAYKFKKKIAIITFSTQSKQPETKLDFFKLFKHEWSQYIKKRIGMQFLVNFWIRFCQIYFDQEHQSFRKQVARSFNIAKEQSRILLKKEYLQGLSNSEIQKQIDSITSKLLLYIQKEVQEDEAIDLQNGLKGDEDRQIQDHQYAFTQHAEQLMMSTSLSQNSSTLRREQQILSLHNHQIGCNQKIYLFLEQFYMNIRKLERGQAHFKTWVEYHQRINQTNLLTFAKTIYHKLLRSENKFELGVQFKDMSQSQNPENSNYFRVLQQSMTFDSEPEQDTLDFFQQIKKEYAHKQSGNFTQKQIKNKKKKVQIYFNVAQTDLMFLFQSFKNTDQSILKSNTSFRQSLRNEDNSSTIFRILIVQSSCFKQEMKNYLSSKYSCRISKHVQNTSFIENIYHACDVILSYSKRIENFNFQKLVKSIYPRNNSHQQFKSYSPNQVKQKIIQFFGRNQSLFQH